MAIGEFTARTAFPTHFSSHLPRTQGTGARCSAVNGGEQPKRTTRAMISESLAETSRTHRGGVSRRGLGPATRTLNPKQEAMPAAAPA